MLPRIPPRALLVGWAIVAALNLGAGAIIATRPERQSDLQMIRAWALEWIANGTNVYQSDQTLVDYPPNAIVVLSPLGLFGHDWAAALWAIVNLGLAVAASFLAVRAVAPRVASSVAALPVVMFLCWGGFRTLLQFSLVSCTLGLLALVTADRQPLWSGLSLGLAFIKPQVAAPFLLWALFERRGRLLAVASAVVTTGVVVFCIRARVGLWSVMDQYSQILQRVYGGDSEFAGLSSLRPLIALVTESSRLDLLVGAMALVLLGVVGALGSAEMKHIGRALGSAPALAALWCLLTFYHLTYGFVVLLPTAAWLLFNNDPHTRTLRRNTFWALQIGLVFDVPGAWRRVGDLVGHREVLDSVLVHTDRALFAGVFAAVAVICYRGARNHRGSPRTIRKTYASGNSQAGHRG